MRRSKNKKLTSAQDGVSREVMLRNTKSGQWIKRANEEAGLSERGIPSTFVVVNNNTVNYVDIENILSGISAQRRLESIKDIEHLYSEILDSFDNFQTYSAGIEKVFDYCEKNSPRFDGAVKTLAEEIDPSKVDSEKVELLKNTASAFIKVLLVYLYAAVVKNKERVRLEKVIVGRIFSLYENIQKLLERTLAPYKYGSESLDFSSSMYPAFFFDNGLNVHYVERLVQHDSRFTSSLAVFQSVTEGLLGRSVSRYGATLRIEAEFPRFSTDDARMKLVDMLIVLLEDVARLRDIRNEISAVTDDEVLRDLQIYTHNFSRGDV